MGQSYATITHQTTITFDNQLTARPLMGWEPPLLQTIIQPNNYAIQLYNNTIKTYPALNTLLQLSQTRIQQKENKIQDN